MATIYVASSSVSAGRGGGGATGSDGRPSSLNSVSSSYLARSKRGKDSEPQSLVYGGERVIHGVAIALLRGRVEIDNDVEVSTGGFPTVRGYGWASHDVGLYVSEYDSKAKLK